MVSSNATIEYFFCFALQLNWPVIMYSFMCGVAGDISAHISALGSLFAHNIQK